MTNSGKDTAALQARIARLEENETRLNSAIGAVCDGLWDWNLKDNTIDFDRNCRRFLGFGDEPLTGTPETLIRHFIHPEDVDNVWSELHTAIGQGRDSLYLEHRIRQKNDHCLWVSCHCRLIEQDRQGRPGRCIGVITDITRTVADRKALIQAKAEAELAAQTKVSFWPA